MARPTIPHRIVRFGAFELDLSTGELRKHGLRVRIQQQPYQILATLLEHPGEIVTREELVRRLWPNGTFVDFDKGLNAAVTRLRQSLSDSAENPRYVETVARRGYRFLNATYASSDTAAPHPVHTADAIDHTIPRRGSNHRALFGVVGLAILTVVGILLWVIREPVSQTVSDYVQITDFTDSAIAPVLSPDGRTVAFLRSSDWFLSHDQIWVKQLPDGEPVQLTRDARPKFAPAFSPEGSHLAYSVVDPSRAAWDTVLVPVLGGEPRLLLPNAEGLTWLSKERLLFSEIRKGIHMAVVTATPNRSNQQDVYVPAHQRAMAHFSFASPDRKQVLVIEMNHAPDWQPCRLAPFDGSSPGRQVGPSGACTGAGWSPDGKWMYFTVATAESHRLWRQRASGGEPEPITSGPAEAQGVAVAPDGRTIITSMGMQQNSIWVHDARGDRPISTVGSALLPKFSADGSRLYYLVRRSAPDPGNELWEVDLRSERSERLVSGFEITDYDIAPDGSGAVLAVTPETGKAEVWLASMDRRSSPVLIGSGGEDAPYFAGNFGIVFRKSDGKANYLFRMNRDGSGRAKIVPHPILNVMSVSPDGLWIVALVPINEGEAKFAEFAIPTRGGTARRICSGFCIARWAPDGRYFYVTLEPGRSASTIVIPVPHGQMLPDLPESGIGSVSQGLALSGGRLIEHTDLAPGLEPSVYAYVKTTTHRNLFRVPIP